MSLIFNSREDVKRYIANCRDSIHLSFAECVFMDCDLCGLDFRNANFRGAHIINCNFEGAVLTNAVFDDAVITGSNFDCVTAEASSVSFCTTTLANVTMDRCRLPGASFIEATLRNVASVKSVLAKACFNRAYVSNSTFKGSNLTQAKFVDAKIYYCDFTACKVSDVDMTGVQAECPAGLDCCEGFNAERIPLACPAEGSFIAWKACRGNLICKILIPEDAKRSSAFGKKCRASKFKVLEIYYVNPDTRATGVSPAESAVSMFSNDWVYKRGETYEEPNFVNNRFKECAAGLHFFMDKQDAISYL